MQLDSSSLALRNWNRSITNPGNKFVSPEDSIFTFRSIRAMMISQCLSLISTFCD